MVELISVEFTLMRSDKQCQVVSSQDSLRYVRAEVASAAAERVWSTTVLWRRVTPQNVQYLPHTKCYDVATGKVIIKQGLINFKQSNQYKLNRRHLNLSSYFSFFWLHWSHLTPCLLVEKSAQFYSCDRVILTYTVFSLYSRYKDILYVINNSLCRPGTIHIPSG